jgi:hypothetical protein
VPLPWEPSSDSDSERGLVGGLSAAAVTADAVEKVKVEPVVQVKKEDPRRKDWCTYSKLRSKDVSFKWEVSAFFLRFTAHALLCMRQTIRLG